MAKTTISQIALRPEYRQRTQCMYWDYYVDDQRLADIFKLEDFPTPFGWLKPEVEARFAEMLLRKCKSDFKPNRIPLYVCPECADYGCGVFTCQVERQGQLIEWRDFAMENDYEDALRQDDTERWSRFSFDATEYYHVFERFLGKRETPRRPVTAVEAPQPRTKRRKKR